MKCFLLCRPLGFLLLFLAGSQAGEMEDQVKAAAGGDAAAIKSLRALGPPGLEAMLKGLAGEVAAVRDNKVRINEAEAVPWRAAVEEVAQQRDAWASGLYWFTDLEAAKAEALRTGRRILSLRLLGHLDEEYCCANSRFFRTVLYANASVSKLLREKYVLHWKSVRPAPLLTIDMGDGRRIKRTITGNSIHYLLDAGGQVLDAFPGIYSPAAFLSALARTEQGIAGLTAEERRRWHGKEGHFACVEWLASAARAGVYGSAVQESMKGESQAGKVLIDLAKEAFPGSQVGGQGDWALMLDAEQQWRFEGGQVAAPGDQRPDLLINPPARKRTMSNVIVEFPYPTEFDPPKGMVERPIMKQALPGNADEALDPASPRQPGPSLIGRMTPETWARMAAPLRPLVELDEGSLRLMIQKLPEEMVSAEEVKTGRPTGGGTPFGRLVTRFEEAVARDMVRNEYYYHTAVRQWLEEDKEGLLTKDVEALNRKVYAELFLTPDYDAWLGLVPEDTYTALEKDGCACDPGAPSMQQMRR